MILFYTLHIFFILLLFGYVVCLLVFFAYDLYASFQGAFFAPTRDTRLDTMLKLAKLKKGQKVADLGSGDGKIVLGVAKQGVEVDGYEIHPLLVWKSRFRIWRQKLQHRAKIHPESYWTADLSGYDVIMVYGITHIMDRMEKKLRKELKPGARVISNYFQFPHWKPVQSENDVHVYVKK